MEAVAIVPALILAALIGWQLVLAGQTLWLCAAAARTAARAERGRAEPGEGGAQRGAELARARHVGGAARTAGAVRVELRLPILLRAWQSPVRVAAVASLGGEP